MIPDQQFFARSFAAPFGAVLIVVSDNGVRYVMFENDAHPKPLHGLNIHVETSHPILDDALEQLSEYFDGSRVQFDLPLDLHGTDFQVAAWKSLARIPFGRTWSYGEQAASIGRPTAVRAIGGANGRNPIAVVLPCHRVVGANGALTGFGGGIEVKKWLLNHEKSVIANNPK